MKKHKPTAPSERRRRHLRVPVFAHEGAAIEKLAEASGLSVAAYLRNVGMGFEVRGVLDLARVDDLARINGDLGRLGGLLKLWLTNDEKLARFDPAQMSQTIAGALDKIAANQESIRSVIKAVVRS